MNFIVDTFLFLIVVNNWWLHYILRMIYTQESKLNGAAFNENVQSIERGKKRNIDIDLIRYKSKNDLPHT